MLSLNGFKVHLNNVEHYTNLYHAHKAVHFLKPVYDSKQVLIDAFTEQQNKIERYEKALKTLQNGNETTYKIVNEALNS